MANADLTSDIPENKSCSLKFPCIILTLCQIVGGSILGFLRSIGVITSFTARAVKHCFLPPFYPRLIIKQFIDIGYYSLPVVGMTAIFTGMVLGATELYRVYAI